MDKEAQFYLLEVLYELEEQTYNDGNIKPISLIKLYQSSDNKGLNHFFQIIKDLKTTRKVYLIFPEDLPDIEIDEGMDEKWMKKTFIQSQIFEIIKLIKNFRLQIGDDYRKISQTLRYRRTYKFLPKREFSLEKFKTELKKNIQEGIFYKNEKYYCKFQIGNQIKLIEAIESVCGALKKKYGNSFNFSYFQMSGIKTQLYSKFFIADSHPFPKKHFIITGGVGTGKTLIYLVPVLIETIFLKKILSTTQFNTVIFFPRVSLSIEQYGEIISITKHLRDDLRVSVLPDVGGKLSEIAGREYTSPDIDKSIEICYKDNTYDIIITNIETFKNRINHPNVASVLPHNVKNLIFDEVHLISGKKGKHITYLFKRLIALVKRANDNITNLSFTGVSATINTPKFHLSQIFSISDLNKIRHIQPKNRDLKPSGHLHHIFLRNEETYKHNNLIIANLTSLIIHNRRDKIKVETSTSFGLNIRDYKKSIIFLDSKKGVSKLNSKINKQEFPITNHSLYSVYSTPLLNSKIYRNLKQNNSEATNQIKDICRICKVGEKKRRFKIEIENINLKKNEFFQIRLKRNKYYAIEELRVEDYIDEEKKLSLGNFDYCPFYKENVCWYLSLDSYELNNQKDFKYGIKSKSVSSETINLENISSANDLFLASEDELFDNKSNKYLFLDLLITTPVIEVGLNISNLNEGVGTKFIRNFAAYHQKVGRIGREAFSDSIFLTVLSKVKMENYFSYIFINEPNYIDQMQNPVYLKARNEYFERLHVFNAIMDYISLNKEKIAKEIYYIEKIDYNNIKYLFLNEELSFLKEYLREITQDFKIIEESIKNFVSIISDLSFRTKNISIAELIIDKNKLRKIPENIKESNQIIKDINAYYNANKNRIKTFPQIFNVVYFKKKKPFIFPKTYFLKDSIRTVRINLWKSWKDFQNNEKIIDTIEEENFQNFLNSYIPTLLVEKKIKKRDTIFFCASGPLEEIFITREHSTIRFLKIDLNTIKPQFEFELSTKVLNLDPINLKSIGGDGVIDQLILVFPNVINLAVAPENIGIKRGTLQIIDNNEFLGSDNGKGEVEKNSSSSIKTFPLILKKILKYKTKIDKSKNISFTDQNLILKIEFLKEIKILEASIGAIRKKNYEKEIPIFFFKENNHCGIGRILKSEGIKIVFNNELIRKYIDWKKTQSSCNDSFRFHLFYLSLFDLFYEYYSLHNNFRYNDSSVEDLKNIFFTEWLKIDKMYKNIPFYNKNLLLIQNLPNSLANRNLDLNTEKKISKFFASKLFDEFKEKLMKEDRLYVEQTWIKSIIISISSVILQWIKKISGMDDDDLGLEINSTDSAFELIFYDDENFGNGICEKIFKDINSNSEVFSKELIERFEFLLEHHKKQIIKSDGLDFEFIDLQSFKEIKPSIDSYLKPNEKKTLDQIICIISCIDCIYDEKMLKFNNIFDGLINIFLLSDLVKWYIGR